MTDMLNGLISFVKDPIDTYTYQVKYEKVSPTHVDITTTSYGSLSAFVAAYDQYNELSFADDINVTVDPGTDDEKWGRDTDNDGTVDYYAIPVFCIEGTHTIAFSGGIVYLAVYNKDAVGYTDYSSHQVGYFYDESSSAITAETANPKLAKIS